MDIRLSVFPTDLYPRLIAYTSEYKIRASLGLQFRVLYMIIHNIVMLHFLIKL